ncbi:MAG: hypothetical protein IK123_09895 [Lachnospiraceae bacterium]|nr:hypothetical protein [Lachnospiraceae bacterium]
METENYKAGHVLCKFVSEGNEELTFKGLNDEVIYVTPRKCLWENTIYPDSTYCISFWEKNKREREDGSVYFEVSEVVSKVRFMAGE